MRKIPLRPSTPPRDPPPPRARRKHAATINCSPPSAVGNVRIHVASSLSKLAEGTMWRVIEVAVLVVNPDDKG